METCFMSDYSVKMKPFKRSDRPEYEGEYMFIVRVGVDDTNTVEIKDTVTLCKITKLEDKSHESDEDYKPESETDSVSDLDDKRRQLNRESHLFDPEKQNTTYKTKPLKSQS